MIWSLMPRVTKTTPHPKEKIKIKQTYKKDKMLQVDEEVTDIKKLLNVNFFFHWVWIYMYSWQWY